MLQTCMNEQPKSKHFRGDPGGKAAPRGRTATSPTGKVSPRESAKPNRLLAEPDPRFHPARELLICIGWLRLFQEIVRGGIPSARRRLLHET
jgi:hypothetical protein